MFSVGSISLHPLDLKSPKSITSILAFLPGEVREPSIVSMSSASHGHSTCGCRLLFWLWLNLEFRKGVTPSASRTWNFCSGVRSLNASKSLSIDILAMVPLQLELHSKFKSVSQREKNKEQKKNTRKGQSIQARITEQKSKKQKSSRKLSTQSVWSSHSENQWSHTLNLPYKRKKIQSD